MLRSVQRLAPALKRTVAVQRLAAPAAAAVMPRRSMATAAPQFTQQEIDYARAQTASDEPTEADYIESRNMLLSLGGVLTAIGYAVYVIAGEPEHMAAHPHYQPPYPFAKRSMETGAGWWPGRHCQFFEFNCFAQTYAEADRMLAELEKEKYTTVKQ